MRRIATFLVVFLAVGVLVEPVAAEVTPEDLERARQDLREVSARLEGAAIRFEQAIQEEAALQAELDQLAISLANQERELAAARVEGVAVAVEIYMSGGVADPGGLFAVDDITELPARLAYVDAVAAEDQRTLNNLLLLERSYERQRAQLEAALDRQEEVRSELATLTADIYAELEEADSEYRSLLAEWERQEEERRRREEEERRRREEEERRRQEEAAAAAAAAAATSTTTTTIADQGVDTTTPDTTATTQATDTTTGDGADPPGAEDTTTTTTAPPPPPPATGGRVCPVNGATTFTDTWGAPRPGGRAHRGVDMMAARGTSVVAVESETILRLGSGGAGGLSIYLAGSSGDTFYYAHLDGFAGGLSVGQQVAVGQLIGFVGSTGNASYGAPHLHWEYHPGGGGAVNPTPLARQLCG